MSAASALENLRSRIASLEETQRRFSRTIPIENTVDHGLPNRGLPLGCIHEIKGNSLASAIAFSAILAARAAAERTNILYVAADRYLYPLGLLSFGITPDQILYVSTRRRQDLRWVVMEALRCSQIGAVIALVDGLDLTESRRLQLAAEKSGVTGFLLGHSSSAPIAAPITRWNITSIPLPSGHRFDEQVWMLDLLYCRGGRSGRWVLECHGQQLNTLQPPASKSTVRKALAG